MDERLEMEHDEMREHIIDLLSAAAGMGSLATYDRLGKFADQLEGETHA